MWKKVYIEYVVTYEDSLDIVIKGELMEITGMMTLELYYGFTKVYDTHKGWMHNIFQVSMLRIYIFSDPSQVLEVSPIELQEVLSFENQSVVVVDWEMKQLRTKNYPYGQSTVEERHNWKKWLGRRKYLWEITIRISLMFSMCKCWGQNFYKEGRM